MSRSQIPLVSEHVARLPPTKEVPPVLAALLMSRQHAVIREPLDERQQRPRRPLPHHLEQVEAIDGLEVRQQRGAVLVDQLGEGEASPT